MLTTRRPHAGTRMNPPRWQCRLVYAGEECAPVFRANTRSEARARLKAWLRAVYGVKVRLPAGVSVGLVG